MGARIILLVEDNPNDEALTLRALKKNNDREWFQPRKEIFDTKLKAPMMELVEAINAELPGFAPEKNARAWDPYQLVSNSWGASHQREASRVNASRAKLIRRRVLVALAKRCRVRVEGGNLPLSRRATTAASMAR